MMTKEQLVIYGVKLRLAWFRKTLELGSVTEACKYYGIERSTFYYWYSRWITRGKSIKSLYDRPRARKTFPKILSDDQINLILKVREETKGGKHTIKYVIERDYKLFGISEWSINEVLRKNNLLKKRKGKKKRKRNYDLYPYRPGEIGQLDVKHYRRFAYQYSLLDMATRIKFKMVFSRAYPLNSVVFIEYAQKFFEPIFRFKTIRTDQGTEFTYSMFAHVKKPHPFEEWLKRRKINHQIVCSAPYLNGRVEKSHRADKYMMAEVNWSDIIALKRETMKDCIYYNTKRPHYALSMKTPLEYLQSIKGYKNKEPDFKILTLVS